MCVDIIKLTIIVVFVGTTPVPKTPTLDVQLQEEYEAKETSRTSILITTTQELKEQQQPNFSGLSLGMPVLWREET